MRRETSISRAGDLPAMVAHADWGTDPRKRWLARAELQPDGRYLARTPEPAGDAGSMLRRLRGMAAGGPALVGFDFPIGLPRHYARAVEIDHFLTLLPELGRGDWAAFYDVADDPARIALRRPFYPRRSSASARQQPLLAALGARTLDDLRRRCELRHGNRRAASPLFWTLGAQQVGKAAISGWREVLGPGLRDPSLDLAIWPFAGPLEDLLLPGRLVVAETYPAEFYHHLGVTFSAGGPGTKSGKRAHADRASNAAALLGWAAAAGVGVDATLAAAIERGFGFGPAREDPFDAVVGLFGMLNVVLGRRSPGEPDEEESRMVEGWILGQQARSPDAATSPSRPATSGPLQGQWRGMRP